MGITITVNSVVEVDCPAFNLQGVPLLSLFYKSQNTQICEIMQENNLTLHYHRKIYFHFLLSYDTFNHNLYQKM